MWDTSHADLDQMMIAKTRPVGQRPCSALASFEPRSFSLLYSPQSTLVRHREHRSFKCYATASAAAPDPRSPNSESFKGYVPTGTKTGAYDIAKDSISSRLPCIILVSPFLDINVGSVSRAMLNFGMTDLRVVDPVCDIKSEQARAAAVGSDDVLNNARIFQTLKEAIADLHRVMATTVRTRDMTQMILTPQAAAATAVQSASIDDDGTEPVKTGIIFGRERGGLTNDEVALADSIINIPTFTHFSSLNLAQAVNIVGFEIWKQNLEINAGTDGSSAESKRPDVWLHKKGERLARQEEVDSFLGRLEGALNRTGSYHALMDPDRQVATYGH
eukprot:gnl/MRDRNA2_/MRDRNA2_17881_c0_seq1.p1 gnl/MRDRNA2_/MRDRNA2_17881_c0~~gnl/MRDRNA2_/MRDRNA2_17881_c0_seq1.p1  ORF type:complete len:331 (+),score=37.55 gnl/MRDRNA2_/MRDRNA2_17881_c0_seq1:150-1142(+)